MIVSDQLATALATAAVPSFVVLIGILLNNQRLNDLNRNMETRFAEVDRRFTEVNRRIEDSRDLLRTEMFRIEQVLDARLKHLEDER
jgi:hypothetical protein